MEKPLILLVFYFCALDVLHSQDNHYESGQIGLQNSILSGASFSRWVDQTAVINNAATMIFAKESGITLNTATASFEDILFKNSLAENYNLESSSSLIFPGLIAWEVPSLQREGKRSVGVAIYGRLHDRLHITSRLLVNQNIVDDAESPGDEQFTGLYSVDGDLDESAGALGWAERLSDEWSMGFTTQVFFRSQKYREFFSATVISNPDGNVILSESNVNLQYNAAFLQFKGSVAWQKNGWNAGLAMTLPTLRVWSGGDMLAGISLVNMRIHPDSARSSYFANAYLPKTKPRYRYPLAIDGGVSKQFGAVQLSVGASWHAPIQRYTMVNAADDIEFQPSGNDNVLNDPHLFDVWSINRSVVNLMTSAVWQVSDATGLLFGFRTDYPFSEFPDPEEYVSGFQLNKKIWNRYHVSGGAEIRRSRSFWIVGVDYSRGKDDKYPSPYRLEGLNEGNFLRGENGTGVVRQNNLSFLLSFFFQFQQGGGRQKKG